MNLTKSYFDTRKELEKSIRFIDEKLQNAPEGDLKIWKHRGGLEYHLTFPKSKKHSNNKPESKYISSSDKSSLSIYGTKLYYQRLRKALSYECWALKVLCNFDPDKKGKVYDSLPDAIRSVVKPLYTSTELNINKWYSSPFTTNTYELPAGASYTTELGEKVRSRAEYIIANELNNAGLLYHYEELLTLSNGQKRFPDFKVVHPKTGEFYYIEFFGMMDSPEYSESAFKRISEYASEPIYPRMIFIFDHRLAPFSTTTIKTLIQNYFFD